MGQEFTTYSKEELNEILHNYTVLKRLNDPSLGDIILLKPKDSMYTCGLIDINLTSEEERDIFLEKFGKRSVFKHPNVAGLKENINRTKEQLCGSLIKFSVIFEYYENNLSKDIFIRA